MLKAKNSRLGRQMPQSDFDASVQESLADWQAARSSNSDHDPQPFHEVPPVPSRSPAHMTTLGATFGCSRLHSRVCYICAPKLRPNWPGPLIPPSCDQG
ncbi:hypothetical protein BS47DRAFT_1205846 [Hydnum rufescens UP504]|uniref:Uncharacterized protein n=1 Tax=Hydnum rufescens UP504 TaxID=1448309 RepID=A0A9P6ASR8_9AGAM|nr:hypothetical protein BS47DRAFT_1205846 [Hydnum rufescens UP504]